jgi:CRP/FNR family cyclic AMP-dependent transcriptional regulator
MGQHDAVEVLASIDLFSGLSPRALKRVAESTESATFAAGAPVVSEGEAVSGFRTFSSGGVNMYIVVEGSAEVGVNGQAVGTMTAGDYFGELSLIDGGPRSADVVAGSEGMTAIALSNFAFEDLLKHHPEVAIPMLKVLVQRLRRAESSGDDPK